MRSPRALAVTPVVAILTYHALEDSGAVTAVSPARFHEHLESLARSGYEIVDLDRVIGWLAENKPLPGRAVVLTFDDGYRSVRGEAFAELRRRGAPATVFVTTGQCGGHNDWPTQPPEVPRREMLRAEEVRELHAAGWTVGAHSVTHPHLTRIDRDAARREIDESRRWLEDLLGGPVRHFAYPYGELDADLRLHVARGFASACGTRLGLVRSGEDRYLLPRVDAYYLDALLRLGGLHGPPARLYLLARQWLRQTRARARRFGAGIARA
jgi:peptidoglycan/xylan/chitin deacetylase (PgdA/CDA1 family)